MAKYVVTHILFSDALLLAYSPAGMLAEVQDYMRAKISKAVGLTINADDIDLRVRPYPRNIGERGTHYDPLTPRVGIELEMVTRREIPNA